jgi:glycosyltransferase involved in cell wall biosynthesis
MSQIHLLMISLDKKLADQDSPVFKRHLAYSAHVKHLTILILGSKRTPRITVKNLTIIPGFQSLPINEIDVISAQDPLLTGLLGVLLKRVYGKKLNLQLHADYFGVWRSHSLKHRLLYLLLKMVLPHADTVRVVSQKGKQDVQRDYPALASKTFVVPIAVNTALFYQKAKTKKQFTRFISVGRLVPEKNFPLLIDVFALVHKKYPDTTLTIVGNGPEREKLLLRTSYLGLRTDCYLLWPPLSPTTRHRVPPKRLLSPLESLRRLRPGFCRSLCRRPAGYFYPQCLSW